MSHNYSRSKPHRSHVNSSHQHSYNPSIHPETFELDKFAIELLQKDCDGYLMQCESLQRIGIILNKYRLFVIKQNNAQTQKMGASLNNTRLGLVGIGNNHQPFNSMSIPQQKHINNKSNASDANSMNLLAIYQQQVYDNNRPMLNLNKISSMYDFINVKLGEGYNNTALLNDFHHLLYFHCDKENKYQQIYNYLVQQIGTKCVASTCDILIRNNNEYAIYNEYDVIEEIMTRQTINQIHCYFLHSYDIGYKFNDKEYKTINQYENKLDIDDVSDDNMSDNEGLTPINAQSIDEKFSIICKMINKKHSYITRHKKYIKDSKSDVFMNVCKNYNKYVSYMNLIEKCKQFYYWNSYQAQSEIDTVNGGFISDWYVIHKYKDLKQELLQNELYPITKKLFEYLFEKTKEIMMTNKVKKLKANSWNNNSLLRKYNINKRAPITMNHILVLILYCNHYEIQTAFLQSFKPILTRQQSSNSFNYDEIIERHAQYANFSRYLRECTAIYGQNIRSSDKFYHMVYGHYLFTDTILDINSPISVTNSLHVACNVNMYNSHKGAGGLILQLSRYASQNSSYFDCQWISNWCNEGEKLLFNSGGPLRMVTILDTMNSQNYFQYISGINYLNSILHGDKDEDSPSKYGKKATVVLIQHELRKSSKKNSKYSHIPMYIDNLFSNYCSQKIKLIEIDIDQINDRYYSLKKQLITKDDSWVDLNLLCNLFQNVTEIKIKDGPYLTDYTFKRLLNFMDSQSNKSQLNKIVFKRPKEEGIGAEEGIKKYYDAIKYNNWDAFFYISPNNDLITMYFIKMKNRNINDEMDQFAFELWQQLNRLSLSGKREIADFPTTREINGNYLLTHIQQYFANKFTNDDDILIIINELVKHQYLRLIHDIDVNLHVTSPNLNNFDKNYTHFRYQFELDKYREFVKKSEGHFRAKWTIGTDVKVFSTHHSQWKVAKIVKEIGDILIVSFKGKDSGTYNKTVDRYQQNIITESRTITNKNLIKRKQSGGVGTSSIAAASYYYQTQNGNGNGAKRWTYGSSAHTSQPSGNTYTTATTNLRDSTRAPFINYTSGGSTPNTNIYTRGSSRVSFGVALKRPKLMSNDSSNVGTIDKHNAYESGLTGISEITPRISSVFQHRQRRSTHESVQPEFAPCKGDPFWDYYRTIGDISRANCVELIKVMRWISAENIMRQLLQNWLHKKIEPVELPYANMQLNDLYDSNFNLHATSVIPLLRQSLNSKQHPNQFDLPELTRYYEISPYSNIYENDNVNLQQIDTLSVSNSTNTMNEPTEQPLNIIGSAILSFLDQTSFLNACLVSRAWLYCSRSARSRSHIKFRLWNALRFLIKDSALMLIITGNNDIVSITKFMRDRNDIKDDHDDDNNSDKDDGKNNNDENKYFYNDVLINYASGNDTNRYGRSKNNRKFFRKRSTTHDSKNSFPHFFSSRINCSLFENICELQFDFTIPSSNKLIYYINQSLVDSYWDTLSVLFGIETLQKLDILFPDPHILLVAYILQNSLSYSKNSKRIMFPSIGVPKSKFICSSKCLKSLRFAVKSLTLSKLEDMLNIHFEHYYHPIHHKTLYKYHALDDPEYAQYVYSQSNKKQYTKLDIYRLCRKIIHKSLVFDISNALYSLNHNQNNSKVTSIEEISLCDVKCLTQELYSFLNNNANNLKAIDLMFTQKCLCPKYLPPKYTNKHSNNHSPLASINLSPHSNHSNTSSKLPHHLTMNPNQNGSSMYGSNYSSMTLNNQQVSNTSTTHPSHLTLNYSDSDNSVTSHNKNNRDKNSSKNNNKNSRPKKTVSQLFLGILKFLKKQTSTIHEHNHRIRKKFKLAKIRSNNRASVAPKLQITYANKLRVLPLESLSFSFPFDIDISILDDYCELFKFFQINDCSEISIKNIYLDGGCIAPFTSNSINPLNNPLKWSNFMETQIGHIQVLCMKRVLYSSLMFYEKFHVGFVSCLKKIDLQIIYSDEYDDPYLHNLQSREPIHELLNSLKHCQCLEILLLDLIQHHQNPNDIRSSMIPYLDIYEIDAFIKSKYIKKTISKLYLTFNELSTIKYENKCKNIPTKFIRRNHLNLGSILRINSQFKDSIEEIIMSWFGECIALTQIRLIRHIHGNHDHDEFESYIDHINNNNQSNRYKVDKNIDFQNILPFKKKSKVNLDQTDHKLAFYGVSKRKKVGDFYRGEVFGELSKILQPQNPVE